MWKLLKKKVHNKVLLCVGIPHTKEVFMQMSEKGSSDYLSSLMSQYKVLTKEALWAQYEPTAKLIQDTIHELQDRNVDVIKCFGIDHIATFAMYDIVIVIAHHSDVSDEIELTGELISTHQFISAIPTTFKGLLDLSSCYSTCIQNRIKIRCPQCRVLAINTITSLKFRLFLCKQVIKILSLNKEKEYVEAFSDSLGLLCEIQNLPIIPQNKIVYLGGKMHSTVFAPKEAPPGYSFVIQIFIHKDSESNSILFIAREVDNEAEKRNQKSLSIKLRKNDKIDFQLDDFSSHKFSDDFKIDSVRKSLIWGGEPVSVEYVISVSSNCNAKSFIGKVKIRVNKLPAGDFIFKTDIISNQPKAISGADIEFISYDKTMEMAVEKTSLLKQLNIQRELIISRLNIDLNQSEQKNLRIELDMCEKCISIINSKAANIVHPIKKVFISSTSDMSDYRRVIKDQVEACKMFPEMYENWFQDNSYPRDLCCEQVLGSDIFICILGANYGYIEPLWGKSMTEIEYRVAFTTGIPILIYIMDNYKEQMLKMLPDQEEYVNLQKDFINEVRTKRMVGFFEDDLNLALQSRAELTTLKNQLEYENITQRPN